MERVVVQSQREIEVSRGFGMPRVSVITVAFNEVVDIAATLDSVLSQKGVDIELIVIDGGSTDGTLSILDRYRASLAYLVSEPDDGIFDAMNKGLRAASGEWLVFMNGGDRFADPGSLRTLLANSGQAKVVYGSQFVGQKEVPPHPLEAIECGVIPFSHQAVAFKLELGLDLLAFDIRYRLYGDYDVVARIYREAPDTFRPQNVAVCVSRAGGVSSMASWRKRREKYEIVFRHFGLKGLLRSIRSRVKRKFMSAERKPVQNV